MHSKKKYSGNIKHEDGKPSESDEIRALKVENRRLLKENKSLRLSRDNWKSKHKSGQAELKAVSRQSKAEIYCERHPYPKSIMELGVMLKIEGSISYKAVCRVFEVLNTALDWNAEKLPCANTIQNWVAKTGLHELEGGNREVGRVEQTSLIIDESIRLGQEKLLLALEVPALKKGREALSMKDVKVLFMEGATSWTGRQIQEALSGQIGAKRLCVANIISDQGPNLKKASRLLGLEHVADISHAMGTCLQRAFDKEESYKSFTSQIAHYARTGGQQEHSYLLPPKQRAKSRFMNQGKAVDWAKKMLNGFEQLSEKEQSFFGALKNHRKIVGILDSCLQIAKEISLLLKKAGLSAQTVQEIERLMERAKECHKDPLTAKFLRQVDGYIANYSSLLKSHGKDSVLHVCSDVIESIFGKYKENAGNSALTGLTRLNLEIPLYCLNQKELQGSIPKAIERKFIADLEEWKRSHSTENQLIKRVEFFKKCA